LAVLFAPPATVPYRSYTTLDHPMDPSSYPPPPIVAHTASGATKLEACPWTTFSAPPLAAVPVTTLNVDVVVSMSVTSRIPSTRASFGVKSPNPSGEVTSPATP
jgi:hypothetical protein